MAALAQARWRRPLNRPRFSKGNDAPAVNGRPTTASRESRLKATRKGLSLGTPGPERQARSAKPGRRVTGWVAKTSSIAIKPHRIAAPSEIGSTQSNRRYPHEQSPPPATPQAKPVTCVPGSVGGSAMTLRPPWRTVSIFLCKRQIPTQHFPSAQAGPGRSASTS